MKFIFAITILFTSIFLVGYFNTTDISAAGNNCCTYPGCPNFNGDWVAGYNACSNGQCSKCSGGAHACDNDNRCEPGENDSNCASDCDEAGFSQLGEGITCVRAENDRGFDQCNEGSSMGCVVCPNTHINAGDAFCSTNKTGTIPNVTPTQQFLTTYCGGLVQTQVCGNNTVETGEQCDPPNGACTRNGQTGTCSSTCQCVITSTAPVCGNNIVETGEQCDPPGSTCTISGNSGSCSNTCACVVQQLPNTNSDGGNAISKVIFGIVLVLFGGHFYIKKRHIVS